LVHGLESTVCSLVRRLVPRLEGSAPGVEHRVLGGPETQQVSHLIAELGEVLAQVAQVLHGGLVGALHLLPRGGQVAMDQAAHDLLVVLIPLLLQVPPLLGTRNTVNTIKHLLLSSSPPLLLSSPPLLLLSSSHLEAVLSLDPARGGVGADPLVHAGQQVAHGLEGGQGVEGGRQGALVVEVAQPQFSAGKFPLLVFVVLQNSKAQREYVEICDAGPECTGIDQLCG